MAEYVERSAAVALADYAADEHPYEKQAGKPETCSEYNQGWNDACDYIRDKLEEAPAADVVLKSAYERVAWERDLEILQLKNDYGVGLGEKKKDVAPVRRGHWILVDKSYAEYECSVCHARDSDCSDCYGTHIVLEQKHCPHCGAKMILGDKA